MSEAADLPDPDEKPDVAPAEPETTPDEPEAPAEGETPPEPEETPEEPQGASDEDFEKSMERTEREGERHRKRLAEIWGEEDLLHWKVCPACQPFAGMRPPMPWDEEDKDAVRAFIGDGPSESFQHDPTVDTCPICEGLGSLRTGSKVRNMETRPCVRCNGSGYVATGEPMPGSNVPAVGAATAPNGSGDVQLPPIRDRWGREPSDPAFGQDPNYGAQVHSVAAPTDAAAAPPPPS